METQESLTVTVNLMKLAEITTKLLRLEAVLTALDETFYSDAVDNVSLLDVAREQLYNIQCAVDQLQDEPPRAPLKL